MPTYKSNIPGRTSGLLQRTTRANLSVIYAPPAAQAGVPLVGQIYPLHEGILDPEACYCPPTDAGDGGSGSTPVPPTGGGVTDYRDAILAESPLAYLRFGDASSSEVAADASLNARSALYFGAPHIGVAGLVSPDTDTAVRFDAPGMYVQFSGGAGWAKVQRLTLLAMIKLGDAPGTIPLMRFNAPDAQAWGRAWRLWLDGGKPTFSLGFDAEGYFDCRDGASLIAGVKYHLAATWDGYIMRLYKNGAEIETLDLSALPRTISYSGAYGLYFMLDLNGAGADIRNNNIVTADEFTIIGSALSSGAIASLAAKALA